MINGTRTVSVTGGDTLILAGRVIADLADGNVGELAFPEELMALKVGKDGNAIYAFNAQGRRSDLKVRVIRNSPDDKFLNDLLQTMIADPATFPLLDGQLTKRVGDGAGGVGYDTYVNSGGVFSRNVAVTSNVEGDTEQSVATYEIKFANSGRAQL